jgi:hypothetical protein
MKTLVGRGGGGEENKRKFLSRFDHKPDMVAHVYNPNYLGGGEEEQGLRPA